MSANLLERAELPAKLVPTKPIAVRPGDLDHFLSFVEKTPSCWNWTGYHDRKGYAKFNARKRGGTFLAHRFSYTAIVGPIPDGFTLDHLCRQPQCVNPAHLEAVTLLENSRRSITSTKTTCKLGHALDGTQMNRGRAARYCRTCNIAKAKARREALRRAIGIEAANG